MGIVWVAGLTGLVFLIPKHMWKVKSDFQNKNKEEIFWSTLYSVQCTHIKVLEHSAIWLINPNKNQIAKLHRKKGTNASIRRDYDRKIFYWV